MEEMDWANLNKYKEENRKISSQLFDENRIVFFGDSITEQWLEIVPDFFLKNNYINRGIGGQTTPQMLIRFRNDVIKLNPSVVHILAGTNDIAGNTGPTTLDMILDNIISMVELAKVNNIKVLLSSVLPVYDYPWAPGLNPAKKIVELNKMINKYAKENSISYINYYLKMVDNHGGLKQEYTTDGVHLTKIGYERIMIPMVKKSLKKISNN